MTTRYPLNFTLPELFRIILIYIALSPSLSAQSLKLWYRQPADALAPDTRPAYEDDPAWLSALPLGNGSLGAMVFGDVNKERIQLNEKTLWSGSHSDNNNPEAVRYIDTIRQLLFEGKYKEATELTNRTQVCKGAGSGHGSGANVPFGCFQTLGDLWIDFGKNSEYANYYRDLNLETALANVRYTQDGVRFTREYFVSAPDNMLVVRLTSSKKGALSFKTTLSRPERFSLRNKDKQLVMSG
ncbi:MAG TPA: alpha-L-fucosidase, partial [Saprospirales bacterium]|nr:alpha-L-fucosidase [Saprospirales bacterium]